MTRAATRMRMRTRELGRLGRLDMEKELLKRVRCGKRARQRTPSHGQSSFAPSSSVEIDLRHRSRPLAA
jgi:hypothetical protein